MIGSVTSTAHRRLLPHPRLRHRLHRRRRMLIATVGTNDGTNITLTMNGTRVTHLTAGTYEIQVHDNSTFHNFHLTGPGVDRKTEIDFKGTRPGR